jgi:F-type H+-transporting ATPase subunit a
MGNLFSIFDPNITIITLFAGNWLSAGLLFLFLPSPFWAASNQLVINFRGFIKRLITELRAVLGNLAPLGRVFNLLVFFFFILFSNFLGLFPYIFTSSSHLRFSLALALPFWLGCILWSAIFQYKNILVHLVPVGTPPALIPVIVIIETVRNLIRPGALAVRLAANIVAGHLLLSLIGGQGPALGGGLLVCLIGGLVLLIALECAVACIQAYVFTILRTLYLNELIRLEFNQKIL